MDRFSEKSTPRGTIPNRMKRVVIDDNKHIAKIVDLDTQDQDRIFCFLIIYFTYFRYVVFYFLFLFLDTIVC